MAAFSPIIPHALATVPPERLEAARERLHVAVQLLGAFGNTFVAEVDDDTHTTLAWDEEIFGFSTRHSPGGWHLVLPLAEQVIRVHDAKHRDMVELRLSSCGFGAAKAWLEARLGELGASLDRELEARDYGLSSLIAKFGGDLSSDDPEAVEALGHYFSATWSMLEGFASSQPEASEVRIWPHHFDVAVLRMKDEGAQVETAPSVNVGMSAGDGSSAEPYWYVVPYPAPEAAPDVELPAGGRWQTEGFFGALLGASSIAALGEVDAQGAALASFFEVAFEASLSLL